MKGTDEYDNMRRFLQLDKNPIDEQYLSLLISKFLLLLPESTNKATPGLSVQDNAFSQPTQQSLIKRETIFSKSNIIYLNF